MVIRWTHPESYNIPVVHYKAGWIGWWTECFRAVDRDSSSINICHIHSPSFSAVPFMSVIDNLFGIAIYNGCLEPYISTAYLQIVWRNLKHVPDLSWLGTWEEFSKSNKSYWSLFNTKEALILIVLNCCNTVEHLHESVNVVGSLPQAVSSRLTGEKLPDGRHERSSRGVRPCVKPVATWFGTANCTCGVPEKRITISWW